MVRNRIVREVMEPAWIGVSEMRGLNSRNLPKLKTTVVLANNRPIAAIIPYRDYVEIERMIGMLAPEQADAGKDAVK